MTVKGLLEHFTTLAVISTEEGLIVCDALSNKLYHITDGGEYEEFAFRTHRNDLVDDWNMTSTALYIYLK